MFSTCRIDLLHDQYLGQLTLLGILLLWQVLFPCFKSRVYLAEFLEFRLLGKLFCRCWMIEEDEQVAADFGQFRNLYSNGPGPRRLGVLMNYARVGVGGP